MPRRCAPRRPPTGSADADAPSAAASPYDGLAASSGCSTAPAAGAAPAPSGTSSSSTARPASIPTRRTSSRSCTIGGGSWIVARLAEGSRRSAAASRRRRGSRSDTFPSPLYRDPGVDASTRRRRAPRRQEHPAGGADEPGRRACAEHFIQRSNGRYSPCVFEGGNCVGAQLMLTCPSPPPPPPPPGRCNQQNKQKAMYANFEHEPPLSVVPALDMIGDGVIGDLRFTEGARRERDLSAFMLYWKPGTQSGYMGPQVDAERLNRGEPQQVLFGRFGTRRAPPWKVFPMRELQAQLQRLPRALWHDDGSPRGDAAAEHDARPPRRKGPSRCRPGRAMYGR